MQSNGVWTQQQELSASDRADGSEFGYSMSVGGDTVVVVEATDSNTTYGKAYVFVSEFAPQTISFGALANQALGAAPFTINATASSGLPVSFDSQTTSICTVSGSTVTVAAVGTCTVQATQAGSDGWAAAPPVNQSFQVAPDSQTIAFGAVASQGLGAPPFTVSATASSGLPVSFNSQTAGFCTVSGSQVTLVGTGTCTIQATQAGNSTYAAAAPVNQSFLVTPSNEAPGFWTQWQELTALDGAAGDEFGNPVSVSGDTMVIGVPTKTVGSRAHQGVAYVFVLSGGVWSLQQELTAFDGGADDYFGNSVSVDGDTVVIGASNKTIYSNFAQGAVYVFVRSGGIWSQEQELLSDGSSSGYFGWSVSVSGDTAVIGTIGGSAYVFVQSGGVWTQQQELTPSGGDVDTWFGRSVSLSGDTAVIGARGAAYVFVQSGGVWTQQQELTASDGAANDEFGYSVSVSGGTAMIGAPYRAINSNTQQGAAYVFVRSGAAWIQQQELTASDGAGGDWFGYSVSVSGDAAAIGAYGHNLSQGVAYVFVGSGGVWTQQQELVASDGVASNYDGSFGGDQFGYSVSVSGGSAAIGAPYKTINSNANQGAAYVFATAQPIITGVISASAFGALSAAAPGSWIEIYGSNMASTTRLWTGADFNGNTAPTSLSGTQVTVGGQSAFLYFISPGQVNAQVPSNIGPGPVPLTVTNGGITSAPVNLTVDATEPGLLAPPSFKIGANQFVVAQFSDGTYVLPTGAIAGIASRPAKPGETIVIYGIGFGSVSPNTPAGQIATVATELSASLQFLFGQTPAAQVPYDGLAPGFVGLYQFNVTVPQVPDNDLVPLTFNLGGVPGTQTLYTAVQQ